MDYNCREPYYSQAGSSGSYGDQYNDPAMVYDSMNQNQYSDYQSYQTQQVLDYGVSQQGTGSCVSGSSLQFSNLDSGIHMPQELGPPSREVGAWVGGVFTPGFHAVDPGLEARDYSLETEGRLDSFDQDLTGLHNPESNGNLPIIQYPPQEPILDTDYIGTTSKLPTRQRLLVDETNSSSFLRIPQRGRANSTGQVELFTNGDDSHVRPARNARRICDACGKILKDSSGLRKHIATHRDEPRKCPCPVDGCDRAFGYPKDLKRHVKTVHLKERRFICPNCKAAFARKDHLKRHCLHQHSLAMSEQAISEHEAIVSIASDDYAPSSESAFTH